MVNELFCRYAAGYRVVYNMVIRFLCEHYKVCRAEVQASADRYADSKGYAHYMATKKDMDRSVADKYAFAHTYEEADLLEKWTLQLDGTEDSSEASFEVWICEGNPSQQMRLQDQAERAPIRQEMRNEIRNRATNERR